jgi:hypothetical protein
MVSPSLSGEAMTDRELMQMALDALELTDEPRFFSQRESIKRLRDRLAQPEREWVGLTDEELKEIFWASLYRKDLAQAIEAKLKEKNVG